MFSVAYSLLFFLDILIELQKKSTFEVAPLRALTGAQCQSNRAYVTCGFAAHTLRACKLENLKGDFQVR